MRNDATFETDSLSLASFIVAKGFKLESIKDNYPKKIFVFAESLELSFFVEEYQNLGATIEPQRHFSAIRFLKSVLHSKEVIHVQ